MFPGDLFEDDYLVWGLCPFASSPYSQASAQPCFWEQFGARVGAGEGAAGQPGLPLPSGVQSPLSACQATLPRSHLQKPPTAGHICNANGKQNIPSHGVTVALPTPACFSRDTPLLQECATPDLPRIVYTTILAQLPFSALRRGMGPAPHQQSLSLFWVCTRCKAAAAVAFHFPIRALLIFPALAQGRHPSFSCHPPFK